MLTLRNADLAQMVEEEGYSVVPSCLDEDAIQRLSAELGESSHAKRNLLADRTEFLYHGE